MKIRQALCTAICSIKNTNRVNIHYSAEIEFPPGVNIVDTGSFTEQLDQLKGAIQARNMESVVSLSEPLAADRTAFLNRIFSTFDRIDVTFDDVTENGDSASAMVNLSLFIRGDDGNFYPGGKWNNRANFSRENGIWQKIRW